MQTITKLKLKQIMMILIFQNHNFHLMIISQVRDAVQSHFQKNMIKILATQHFLKY